MTPYASRFTPYDQEVMRYALCAMRFALCFTEMAQDRLEECMQAVVTGTHPRTIER